MNLLEVGIPTVPLRGMVVYPNIVIHLDIGRDKSIKAVEAAMNEDRILAVVTPRIIIHHKTSIIIHFHTMEIIPFSQ